MEGISMGEMQKAVTMAEEFGFSHVGELACETIKLLPDVRSMCASGQCAIYGKSWACPPACGTLEECGERIKKFKRGIIVQTTGELEDALDGETMMEAEAEHKEKFVKFREILGKQYPQMLALGAGTCRQCKECTYPDAPCCAPERAMSSMEAYGMLVTQVCQDNGLPYYYGDLTITYTSCYLLE